MRKIMYLLLALLLLGGCRSKKVKSEELKVKSKTAVKSVRDSATHVEKHQKISTFDLQHSQSYEITLESDKDSVGNAKELFYNRVRDGTSETITVRGGIVRLKANSVIEKDLVQLDSIIKEDTKVSTNEERNEQREMLTFDKKKEVKSISYILLITSLIVGIVLIYIVKRKAP